MQLEELAKEFDRIRKEEGTDEVVLRYSDAAAGVQNVKLKKVFLERLLLTTEEDETGQKVIILSAI